MAFNAGAIVAKLKLDSKEYAKGIKGAKSQARGLTAELKKNQKVVRTQQQRLKAGGMAAAKYGAAIGGAALAVAGLVRVAKRTVELAAAGAKIRDMEMAFDRLAERAGTSSSAVVGSVKAITGSLSNKQIMESANMLELLGVGMENTAKLTEIARAAGVALGKDVGFMLESIATGTARQSRLWLDNLGIIISIDEANRDYAKTLGKTASALTDTERRAAFLNAVLSKGDDIVTSVGTDSELASEGIATLTANIINLADAIKKDLSEAVEEFKLDQVSSVQEIIYRNFGIRGFIPGMSSVGKGTPLGELQRRAFDKANPPKTETPTQNRFGALARTQGARDKVAADLAAAAKKFFNDIIRGAKYEIAQSGIYAPSPMGAGSGVRQGRGAAAGMSVGFDPTLPRATIDWTEVADPLADVSTGVAEVSEGMQEATSMASNFFSTLVTGAITAGAGFEKVMMGAISTVASALGQMIQWGGMGMGALAGINPVAAIVAGAALMGIAGIMRGRGSSSAPHIPSYQSVTPRTQEVEQQGAGVVIHVDNFVGDPAWLDGFMRRINQTSRANGYAEVFFNAP